MGWIIFINSGGQGLLTTESGGKSWKTRWRDASDLNQSVVKTIVIGAIEPTKINCND
ncbi:hypothetical protein [Desulforhabdus amnigena]|uniref:hypothetical protein n=1 Tax=Desulforhabdus amnigena TaxID=40218 RepID=UPI0016AC0A72|nr:hypothetical protein [Desulforhabdus amnigena]NLJ26858.1 hypothetical protein [Deltaproteobacteria bacterium]